MATNFELTAAQKRVLAATQKVWKQQDYQVWAFLTTPHRLLENKTPLDAAESEAGTQRVMEILNSVASRLQVQRVARMNV